jgi:hypothetical protein
MRMMLCLALHHPFAGPDAAHIIEVASHDMIRRMTCMPLPGDLPLRLIYIGDDTVCVHTWRRQPHAVELPWCGSFHQGIEYTVGSSSKRARTKLHSSLISWHLQQGEAGKEMRKPKPYSLLLKRGDTMPNSA